MRRREFLGLVGGAAVTWPPTFSRSKPNVCADEVTRRLGVLVNLSETDPEGRARIAAFREGLNGLGWIEGRNIQIEYRWVTGDLQRLSVYAAELVAWKPDIIFAATSASALALQRETTSIPIVFAQALDPIANKLVARVPRPGGNITGFALYEYTIAVH